MTYIVETSSGVLETEDPHQYVAWLDEYGPEVISSHEPDGYSDELREAFMQQYAKQNPRPQVGSIYPS